MQPTNSEHWKRMKSCSSIRYERSRPRKNGCACFRMAKNSQTSESKDRESWQRLHVNSPRRAVAARENAMNNPPPVVSKPSAPSKPASDDQTKVTVPAPKKEGRTVKKALKGVIVKKKPKGEPSLARSPTSTSTAKRGDDAPPEAKRRKITTV